jgi:hypothetical protein
MSHPDFDNVDPSAAVASSGGGVRADALSADAPHSRRRGLRWERGDDVSEAHRRCRECEGYALDLWAQESGRRGFDFEPDPRVLEPASSDHLADAVGDPLARPRRAAVRCAAMVSRCAVPEDVT